MAQKQRVDIEVMFEAQTQALKEAEKRIAALEGKMAKTAKAGKAAGASFSALSGIIGKIGISAFFLKAVADAARMSPAIEELQGATELFTKELLEQLAPALNFISKGLQGLLIVVSAITKSLINDLYPALVGLDKVLRGQFREGWAEFKEAAGRGMEGIATSVLEASERIAGRTKIIFQDQAKVVVSELQRTISTEKMTNAERIRRIDEAEAEVKRIYNEAARGRGQIRAAERQQQTAILTQLGQKRQDIIARQATDELELYRATAELRQIEEQLTLEQRREILAQDFEMELAAIEAHGAATLASEEKINADKAKAKVRHLTAMRALDKMERDEQKKVLDQRTAIVKKYGDIITSEASKAEGNIEDLMRRSGARIVQQAAKEAADLILIRAAAAAWNVMKTVPFPVNIVAAAGVLAAGAAAAAAVAALGGAAAKSIAGGAPPSAPTTGPYQEPSPVTTTPETAAAEREYGTPAAEIAARGVAGPARVSVVEIHAPMGGVPRDTIEDVREVLAEAAGK